ncbi:hypothetical protein CHS0354_024976 [Potamilus streckersoni]|uniref:Uncharacterized protein n=1 Tax=Potamilus streckersoni TaxID=2493646 RepID=A0AAE0W6A1_9BIVA|nr:hypothetical protein CHS0354_024976 [Potamilus streckersoni]
MINTLLLSLSLIVGPYFIQCQDMITDTKNIMEDDMSFSLLDTPMQRSGDENTITAANSKCKTGIKCGYHQGTRYSWCDTDHGMEFCCTGECQFFKNYLRCPSGTIYAVCGNPGPKTAKGTSCLPSHPCGAHGVNGLNIFTRNYYWCYTDESKAWERCCNPRSKCSRNQCNTGIIINAFAWHECKP